MSKNQSVLLLIILLLLPLYACNHSDSSDESPPLNNEPDVITATHIEHVDFEMLQAVRDVSNCFDTNGNVQAGVHVYPGNVTDWQTQLPEQMPLSEVRVTQSAPDFYQFILEVSESNDYTAIVVCDAAQTAATTDAPNVPVQAFHYFVRVDSDAGIDPDTKPDMHLNSTDDCDGCHSMSVDFAVSKVNHQFVVGLCISCHRSDHTIIEKGTCIDCHDGENASGKPAAHRLASDTCDQCHSIDHWAPLIELNHSQYASECDSCHRYDSVSHVESTHVCHACHKSLTDWLVKNVDHRQATGPCKACHAESFPDKHIPVSQEMDCGMCHNTVDWQVLFDHTIVPQFDCANCHNNVNAIGKLSNHILSTDHCSACHTTAQWLMSSAHQVDHREVIGDCKSCHDAVIAAGKPALHIPTSMDCVACHSTQSWSPAIFDHRQVQFSPCTHCHDGIIDKPFHPFLYTASSDCSLCHTVIEETGRVNTLLNHAGIIGGCTICHVNASDAAGRPVDHVVTSEDCVVCHFTDRWIPAK